MTDQELDRPIHSSDQDKLGRGPFIEQLTRALVDQKTGRSSGLVVSLLGAWGSGKSSALNLLEAQIKALHASAIVLRFDPWLIANRDGLVRQFLSDLGNVLAKDAGPSATAAKKVGELLSEYDDVINVGIDAVNLLSIPLLSGGLKAAKGALKKRDKTLHQLKAEITSKIKEIDCPIVVLIDEVDRLDDGEILEIMRLVKAVADFPNVSYLIAYDVDRVVEALGASARDAAGVGARGRAYLEKIVQHQVFLPALFEAELIEMFRTEIGTVVGDFEFPSSRHSEDRYTKIENAIFPNLIRTPRDLKRSLGIFRAIHSMVGDEVNWMDLLGYATLLAKVPSLTERIKSDPIFFSSDFGRGGASYLRYGMDAPKAAEQLNDVLGANNEKLPETKLIKVLFPRFVEAEHRRSDDRTCIEHYRALSFLIRQGTPPGSLPIKTVRELFSQNNVEIAGYCQEAVRTGQFDDFNYILSFHYGNFNDCNHAGFWSALAGWCRKPDRSVPTSHDPRVGYLEIIESSFSSAVSRSQPLADKAVEIVFGSDSIGNVEFAAEILRTQVWAHGLFNQEPRTDFAKIGDATRWREVCLRLGEKWKREHLDSDWFFGSWKESPIWFLMNIGLWDKACIARLDELTDSEPAFDALVMMVFGRHYRVDRSGIDKLMGWTNFARKFQRLEASRTGRELPRDVAAAAEKVKPLVARGEAAADGEQGEDA